ncbi:MAG: hypothetical protein NTU61_03235 [Candidatus Altiarchaeota archaeon]|nr:hypothetical protein [Candidatus Altiarchaeota archaeon]
MLVILLVFFGGCICCGTPDGDDTTVSTLKSSTTTLKPKVWDCNALDSNSRDVCFWKKALWSDDVSLCEKTSDNANAACRATLLKQPSLCNEYGNADDRVICNAVSRNEPSRCEGMSNDRGRYVCYQSAFGLWKNLDGCGMFSSNKTQYDTCRVMVENYV